MPFQLRKIGAAKGLKARPVFRVDGQEAADQRRDHRLRRAGRAVVGLDREAEAELRQGGAIDPLGAGLDEDARRRTGA